MATQSTQFGAYVPTTNIWDPTNIYSTNLDPELKKILVYMYQNLNLMALVLNVKETGQYQNAYATINGQQWFPNPGLTSASSTTPTQRPVLRTVINFGVLPNAAKKSVAHGITCTTVTTFTRIYAVASDTTDNLYIPIPFVDVTGVNPVQLDVDGTNVNITTITDLRKYNICYVVLEYIQT